MHHNVLGLIETEILQDIDRSEHFGQVTNAQLATKATPLNDPAQVEDARQTAVQ